MSRELRAAMLRHPAGKRLTGHTGATIHVLYPVPSLTTATAETAEKGTNHND